jgi:hypothetical protein
MNVATQTVSNTIHNLYTAGVHVIATSHSRKDKDSRGIEVTSPGFMPKLGSKLMGPPQVVGYVNADIVPNPEGVDSYTRFVQILPTINVVAKSKFSELPPKVDFETLVEAFRSFLTSNDDIRVI